MRFHVPDRTGPCTYIDASDRAHLKNTCPAINFRVECDEGAYEPKRNAFTVILLKF